MGFEAILAGHRPRVWGQPFSTRRLGLTHDRTPPPRRGRKLTPAQLFAAAMILAPVWYDPCRDRLGTFEDARPARGRSARLPRGPAGLCRGGMRAWKRAHLRAFFGQVKPLVFRDDPAEAARVAARTGRRLMVWAGKAPEGLPAGALRVEDGFLRSRGLGADLVPPCRW